MGPDARVQVGSLVLKEVHGHIQELEARTAAEEHYLVGIGDVEKFFPVRADFIHHLSPLLGSVRD